MSRSKRNRRRTTKKTERSSDASREATPVEPNVVTPSDPPSDHAADQCEETATLSTTEIEPAFAIADEPTETTTPDSCETKQRNSASEETGTQVDSQATGGDRRWDQLFDLLQRIDGNVSNVLDSQLSGSPANLAQNADANAPAEPALEALSNDERDAYETRLQELRELLQQQEDAYQQLHDDYEGLATQHASDSASETIRQTVQVDESLSWDERKQVILQQMETGDFDAESFVSSLSQSQQGVVASEGGADGSASLDADDWIRQLLTQVEKAGEALQERETEINELRACLEHQKEALGSPMENGGGLGGTAMGAAAIAEMIDSDELIREERQRLQELKTQWEEKFRSAEVAASLERAKLSRERQELAKRNAELEERLEQLQRDQRMAQRYGNQDSEGGKTPRKWLAELGLTGSGKA